MAEKYPVVHLLVNNAATAFKRADPETFEQQCLPTIRTNFDGSVKVTEAVLPMLRKAGGAKIVNVASMAGKLK